MKNNVFRNESNIFFWFSYIIQIRGFFSESFEMNRNFRDLPKAKIVHKFRLIMWIDDCNFIFMLTQIGKMFAGFADDRIH